MPAQSADRTLLFGLLAVQNNFIGCDALVAALSVWASNKEQSLGQVLVAQAALSAERRAFLDTLIQQHTKQHGQEASQYLATLTVPDVVRKQLERIADPELQQSLRHISGVVGPDDRGGEVLDVLPAEAANQIQTLPSLNAGRIPDLRARPMPTVDFMARPRKVAWIVTGVVLAAVVLFVGALGTAWMLMTPKSNPPRLAKATAAARVRPVPVLPPPKPEEPPVVRRPNPIDPIDPEAPGKDIPLASQLAHLEHADVKVAAFTPDGRTLVLGHYETVYGYDARTGKYLYHVRPGGDIGGVAITPDGQWLAIGLSTGKVAFYQAATGQKERVLQVGPSIRAVAFAPDGKTMAVVSHNAVHTWDLSSGRLSAFRKGPELICWDARYTPDGKRLFVAAGNNTRFGFKGRDDRLWNASTAEPIQQDAIFGKAGGESSRVLLAPNGKHCALIPDLFPASMGPLRVCDLEANRELPDLPGAASVVAVAFAPNSRGLITGHDDGRVALWDLATRMKVKDFHASWPQERTLGASDPRHNAPRVSGIWVSPDGTRIVTRTSSGVKLWDAAHVLGDEIKTELPMPVERVPLPEVPPAVELRAFGDMHIERKQREVEIVPADPHLLGPLPTAVTSLAFSPDSRWLVVGHGDLHKVDDKPQPLKCAVRLWDPKTCQEIRKVADLDWPPCALAFAPDGQKLLVGGGRVGAEFRACLFDVQKGRELHRFGSPTRAVEGAAACPDGRRAVMVSADGHAWLWDLEKGTEIRRLDDKAGGYTGMALSHDGRRLVTGSIDTQVRVWDLETGRVLHRLTGHTKIVRGVALSPDGRRLASCDDNNQLRLWDTETGRPLQARQGSNLTPMLVVAYTPDGRYVISAGTDRTVRLWDANSLDQVAYRATEGGWVTTLAVSLDGKLIATGGPDKRARLWSLTRP